MEFYVITFRLKKIPLKRYRPRKSNVTQEKLRQNVGYTFPWSKTIKLFLARGRASKSLTGGALGEVEEQQEHRHLGDGVGGGPAAASRQHRLRVFGSGVAAGDRHVRTSTDSALRWGGHLLYAYCCADTAVAAPTWSPWGHIVSCPRTGARFYHTCLQLYFRMAQDFELEQLQLDDFSIQFLRFVSAREYPNCYFAGLPYLFSLLFCKVHFTLDDPLE